MKFISKYHLGTRWRLKLITSTLPINKLDYMLDAGCGDGFISYYLSRKVKKVMGVDISKELIEFNKKFSNKNLSFLKLDLNKLPKKFNRTFDKIICTDVLEHAFYFANIIHNFSKALKRGGNILITIPLFEGHGHFKHKDLNYLRKLFEKENFKNITLRYIQMPLFTKLINNLINYFRKLTGYEMKEVDIFQDTLSFKLRKKETLLFRIYKIIFSLLFLLTYLDFKTYRNGEDFILIKAVK